jgi:hypothetical protein
MSIRTKHRPLWLALQIVFAVLLSVLVTGALWWGFARGRAPLAAQGISVEAIFAREPNGPTPDRFDYGEPARSPDARFVVRSSDGESRLPVNGSELTLDLLQNLHRNVSDPRISEWQGSYANFELFANHGLTESLPALEKVWASAAGG